MEVRKKDAHLCLGCQVSRMLWRERERERFLFFSVEREVQTQPLTAIFLLFLSAFSIIYRTVEAMASKRGDLSPTGIMKAAKILDAYREMGNKIISLAKLKRILKPYRVKEGEKIVGQKLPRDLVKAMTKVAVTDVRSKREMKMEKGE